MRFLFISLFIIFIMVTLVQNEILMSKRFGETPVGGDGSGGARGRGDSCQQLGPPGSPQVPCLLGRKTLRITHDYNLLWQKN